MDERKGNKDMKLSDVVARNKDKLFKIAKQNTLSDEKGRTLVKKDDPWLREDDVPWQSSIERKELVKA